MTYSNLWPNGGWSRRHLNWGLILYGWLVIIPGYLVMFVAVGTENASLTVFSVVLFSGAVVWGWYLLVWNLKHKGRSLWNLLYLLIPWIGGIVFLCVSNREQLAKEKSEREESAK